jgi:hypothetical protein
LPKEKTLNIYKVHADIGEGKKEKKYLFKIRECP